MAVERTKERRTWRDYIRLTLVQRGSPESIAWGVAIGTFIAFTPTFGVQIFLALILTTLLRVNRLASLPPLFLTNIATVWPVYTLQCLLGAQFLPDARSAEMLEEMARFRQILTDTGLFSMIGNWRGLMKMTGDLWLSIWIGGVLVGGALATPAYFGTVAVVRRHRIRRARRLQQRARARQPPG